MILHWSSKFVVGVDAGPAQTRCVLVENWVNRDLPTVLGFWETPSSGWVNGRVADPAEVASSIQNALAKVRKRYFIDYCRIVGGIGGPFVRGHFVSSAVGKSDDAPFTERDAAEAVERACAEAKVAQSTLSIVSSKWLVDGKSVESPVGLKGLQFEYSGFRVTSPPAIVEEVEAPFKAAEKGACVPHRYEFEPLAASLAVLSLEERRIGAIVIDIGAQGAGGVVWQDGLVVKTFGLLIGGDLFTRDAAYCLGISYKKAEQAKLRYGLTADSIKLRMALVDRADELIMMLQMELRTEFESSSNESNKHKKPIVLTGGGSLLGGLDSYLEGRLGRPVRRGIPSNITTKYHFAETSNTLWSVATGLATVPYWLYPSDLQIDKKRLWSAKIPSEPHKVV